MEEEGATTRENESMGIESEIGIEMQSAGRVA